MALVAALYIENVDTIVNASQITVYGDNPDKISAYSAYVKNGGRLNLIASNFKDIAGIRAQNAVIGMTVGAIKGISHAVYAWGRETDITLSSVNIEIETDNLNMTGIGLVRGLGAMFRMSSGTVTFNQTGSFSTRFGGHYLLDIMVITGQGQREEAIINSGEAMGILPEAFEISQDGDVYLKNN
ncbi:hypothetical protein [Bartonella birtlesii]|uniref:Uncharacterized protein n=1 Tax=Bartonella birtlesii LL-WM9 TaxID=1094552 RepID=J0PPE2_9HYPH|nr:hypothetical protein [Bartonella birtlesii]EJF74341.1 hypothetical protein ME7_01479 [Bartonella birtlesii LL-WM9]